MGKAVVVLLPHVGGEDEVQRGDGLPPGELVANLQPLGVLRGHGVHNADEGLVAGEEAVTAGEQVAFQPAFAHMLAEHAVHDAAVAGQGFVGIQQLGVPIPVLDLKHLVQAVGHALVRPKDTEVLVFLVELEDVADIAAQLDHVLSLGLAGVHFNAVLAEVGQAQVLQQQAAVGMGVGAQTGVALGSQLLQLGDQGAVLVEQFLSMIALQPLLQQAQMLGSFHGQGHLMGTEGTFNLLAVHNLGTGPALGSAQDDHGPHGPLGIVVLAGVLLDGLDLLDDGVHGLSHELVHGHGIVALHEVGLPAAALEEALNLFMGNTGEHGGVGDLVAVQVQNGQNGAVGNGVQELVGLPGGGQRAGLGFTVAHHHGGDQVGVVQHSAEAVGDGIAQLAALVDGAGSLGSAMAGYAAGEGELLEHLLHALFVAADVGINLAVASIQVGVGNEEVAAMSGTGKEDHIQIITLDGAVAVDIDKVLSRHSAPVAHDLLLDLVHGQGLPQHGVVQQVQLPSGQVVGSTPIGVHLFQHLLAQRLFFQASCFLHAVPSFFVYIYGKGRRIIND